MQVSIDEGTPEEAYCAHVSGVPVGVARSWAGHQASRQASGHEQLVGGV